MRKTFFGSQESYPISITADGFVAKVEGYISEMAGLPIRVIQG